MPRLPYRSELVGADSMLVVSVTWAGRTFRFSERPTTAVDVVEGDILLDGGLPELRDDTSLTLFSDEPTRRTFSTSVVFPADVAELESRGHDLASATAEVARWVVGTGWEDREVFITKGAVTYPEYGEEGEPCSFTIEQSPFDDAALIPEATAVVDATTFPNAHESAIGATYPVVLGSPGYFIDSSGQARVCKGSPALIVEWAAPAPTPGQPLTPDASGTASKLLVNFVPTEATSVYIIDPAGDVEARTVASTVDGRGRLVATVDMTGSSLALTNSGAWWVAWHNGGATKAPDDSGALLTAGEILKWLLVRSSLDLDGGRIAIAADLLQTFDGIGFYIDEATSPWEIARRRLLRWLPATMRVSTKGLYPLVYNWLATKKDAVATINADEAGVVRAGPVKRTLHPREVVSEVRVEYAGDAGSSTRGQLVITGAPEQETGVYTNQQAAHAHRQYGPRAAVVEAPEVYSRATAMRLGSIAIRTRGGVPREVSYDVPPEEDWLRDGDAVLLQDDDMDYAEELAVIVRRSRRADALRFTVSILPDPARTRFVV